MQDGVRRNMWGWRGRGRTQENPVVGVSYINIEDIQFII
jgi:hypothetical protein